jgi:hypothetical protein
MKKAAQVDASMNLALNPVTLPDGRRVPWAVAFPRNFEIEFQGIEPAGLKEAA